MHAVSQLTELASFDKPYHGQGQSHPEVKTATSFWLGVVNPGTPYSPFSSQNFLAFLTDA